MKRLISLVLTIAFALSLCATSSFATGETLTMTPNVNLAQSRGFDLDCNLRQRRIAGARAGVPSHLAACSI